MSIDQSFIQHSVNMITANQNSSVKASTICVFLYAISHIQLYENMFQNFVSPCFCLLIGILGKSNIGNIAYLSPNIQLYVMLTSMYYTVVVSVNLI